MSRWVSASIGAGCCTVAAAGLTPVFSQTSFSSAAPLIFLLIIVLIAVRFGNFAGVLGTIAGALIFAIFLFEPRFSLLISDTSSRNHLIWMVIIGIILSDLLGAYSTRGTKNKGHS